MTGDLKDLIQAVRDGWAGVLLKIVRGEVGILVVLEMMDEPIRWVLTSFL